MMMVVAVLFTMSLGAGDGSVSTNKCIQSAAAGYYTMVLHELRLACRRSTRYQRKSLSRVKRFLSRNYRFTRESEEGPNNFFTHSLLLNPSSNIRPT